MEDKRKRLIIGIVGVGGGILGLSYYMKKREEERESAFDISKAGEKAKDMISDVLGGAGDAINKIGNRRQNTEVSDQTKTGLGAAFPPLAAWLGWRKYQEGKKKLSEGKQKMVTDMEKGVVFPPAAAYHGIVNYWRSFKSLPRESQVREKADIAHGGVAGVIPPLGLINNIKRIFQKSPKNVVTNTKVPGQRKASEAEQAKFDKIARLMQDAQKKYDAKKKQTPGMSSASQHARNIRESLAKLVKKNEKKVVVPPNVRRPKGGGGLIVKGGVRR